MAVESKIPKIYLRAARVNAGLSAKEAADLLKNEFPDLKVKSYQTILKYEKDSTDIPHNLVQALSKIYNYPDDYIFLGKTYRLNSMKA